jgi:ribosomal protein S18 acetylase RimI-like enzyme
MRKASYKDKELVINILSQSFRSDPHVSWLIEESKNKSKLCVLIEYVFGESLERGEIYLSDDNQGVALWNTEKKEKFSFDFIKRNLSFLFQVGLKSTVRALKTNKLVYNWYPQHQPYCQLYLIGVLPEGQGRGLASSLMDPMIEYMKSKNIPMHLETANARNVEIYKKKGFAVYHTMTLGQNTFYLLRK